MSTDFQTISIQDALPVTFLDFALDLPIPTLRVRGKDFRNVSEVLVNGVTSPSYIVVSDSSMLVQLPTSEYSMAITSLLALSSRFTATERSILRLRISPLAGRLSGIEKLVQLFVRTVFTTPGSNIFKKEDGGGLRQLIASPVSKYAQSQITGAFAQAVDRTRSQIVEAQSTTSNLTPEEKLLAADLIGVDFDIEQARVSGKVQLTSMAGKSALVGIYPDQDDS
tara:strand:+ start:281 stop:952 length:672 start_codon:yes stop_codon:yes gene_type:complete